MGNEIKVIVSFVCPKNKARPTTTTATTRWQRKIASYHFIYHQRLSLSLSLSLSDHALFLSPNRGQHQNTIKEETWILHASSHQSQRVDAPHHTHRTPRSLSPMAQLDQNLCRRKTKKKNIKRNKERMGKQKGKRS